MTEINFARQIDLTIDQSSPANIAKQELDALVVPVTHEDEFFGLGAAINDAAGGIPAQVVSDGDLAKKPGSTALISRPAGIKAKRLVLLRLPGIDDKAEQPAQLVHETLRAGARRGGGAAKGGKAGYVFPHLLADAVAGTCVSESLGREIECTGYKYPGPKASGEDEDKNDDKPCAFVVLGDSVDEAALLRGQAIGVGMNITRALGDLPANIATPTFVADVGKQLAEKFPKLSVEVLGREQMLELGFGAFLAVAQGSAQEPKTLILHYNAETTKGKNKNPHVLIGKGVTFDTGGISIKPSTPMWEMKWDMVGAASVVGTMAALAHINHDGYVVGMAGLTENMPGSKAVKPGDVVITASGKSVEILNTDAEGRLVLSDLLHYAKRYEPASVIDIATLTGACVVALGGHATGVMARDEDQAMVDKVLASGKRVGDRGWQLPVWVEYHRQSSTPHADIPNISGGGGAGTITAATFLANFSEGYPWVHLDIAGTAWVEGKNRAATGRPVPMLVEYLTS